MRSRRRTFATSSAKTSQRFHLTVLRSRRLCTRRLAATKLSSRLGETRSYSCRSEPVSPIQRYDDRKSRHPKFGFEGSTRIAITAAPRFDTLEM